MKCVLSETLTFKVDAVHELAAILQKYVEMYIA